MRKAALNFKKLVQNLHFAIISFFILAAVWYLKNMIIPEIGKNMLVEEKITKKTV
jgi:hypothetical protein